MAAGDSSPPVDLQLVVGRSGAGPVLLLLVLGAALVLGAVVPVVVVMVVVVAMLRGGTGGRRVGHGGEEAVGAEVLVAGAGASEWPQ